VHELRSQLWKKLIPANAPLAADVDFYNLGRKFELFPGSIESAIAHASAQVASRKTESQKSKISRCLLSLLLVSLLQLLFLSISHAEGLASCWRT
jgi:hypothetical protein